MPELIVPYQGVSDAAPFTKQPGASVPLDAMRNMRNLDSHSKRRRQGVRPGWSAVFDAVLPGPIQELGVIEVASSISGYRTINCTEPDDFESRESGVLTGQVFLLSNTLSMYRDFEDARTLGGTTAPCPAICLIPGTDRIVYAINHDGTGVSKIGLECRDELGNTIWSADCDLGGIDVAANVIASDGDYVYVASTQGVLYMVDASNGTVAGGLGLDWSTLWGWANQVVSVVPAGDGQHVYALFQGAGFSVQAPNQAPGVQINSADFRSGIMKLRRTGTFPATPLVQARFGPQLSDADPWFEADHGYCRFSEQTAGYPWGCLPTAMAISPDGKLLVTRTNQGWGPNGGYPPNGTAPYIAVCCVAPDGELLWEGDYETNKDAYGTGSEWWFGVYGQMYNDRNDPTLQAVAINGAGYAIVAGRRNAAAVGDGKTCTVLRVADGLPRYAFNTSGTIRENAASSDSTDNGFWVAGDQNNDWTGADGADANFWKLAADSPTVIDRINLPVIRGLGVKVGNDGRMCISTRHF